MKKQNTRSAKKTTLWIAGIIAVVLVIGAIAFKVIMTLRNSDILGTTTVSVSVTCEGVCTDMVGEVIDDTTGQPLLPDGDGEYNVHDPNVTVSTTIQGTSRIVVILTNSAYPAPTGIELLNQIFSSGDPAFDATGELIEILPGGALASYLQLGRNVLDFYITSSVNSPAQDIHRQLIINYTLPGHPDPKIVAVELTNNHGDSLPYKDSTTDYVASGHDLPLRVEVNVSDANRVQLTVTDRNGSVGTVYDGTPRAVNPMTGFATYEINEALNGLPGLKVGKNVISLIVTGLNGKTLIEEWTVYFWPDGIEPPNTGVIQIGNLTIAVNDLLISVGIVAVFIIIWIVVIVSRRKNNKENQKTAKNSKKAKA